MPNHCCNTLYVITGSLSLIVETYIRKDEASQGIFDFEKIVPVGDAADWYEQRLEKWGTKWVGYGVCIGESSIEFCTAWTPPIPIVKKLAELHKGFAFRLEYYETGMAFRGFATAEWIDGEAQLVDSCWDMASKDFEELDLI